ncbi:MAG: flagellar basal-body MS-ring/collar protein FliF [Rhodospirillales bacterium]
MDSIVQALRNLGPIRLGIMGAVVVALLGFFVFLTSKLSTPDLTLLFGDLDPADASKITARLDASKTPYEIKAGGTQIFVLKDLAPKLRISMAEAGLSGGSIVGYELFDNRDSLGTTNFVQNVNLVRALEGELARTIQSLENVKKARVHIVLPKRELFSRTKQEPSASVALRLKKGHITKAQILAVQHLVSAAIPQLKPTRISIVDGKGNLLARGIEDENDPNVLANKAEDRRKNFQRQLARKIETLIEQTVGPGKVRAEINAEMDFDRITTNEEKFDPEGQVVRSTQTIEEQAQSKESEGRPPVSVATNLPDPNLTPGAQAGASQSESRNEETVNFEVSKKVINHIRDVGNVKRLSVAVLVDGIQAIADDGTIKYTPRKKEEMELLATLVRGAIGFNADRDDTVEVINMRFADPRIKVEEELELFFGLDKNDLLRMAEIIVLSIVAILVILLVVRPLVQRAFEAMPSVTDALSSDGKLLPEGEAPAALPGAEGAARPEEVGEELIDIDRIEGRVKASSVRKVGEIVEKHPDEALSILRTWLYQGD